MLNEDRSGIAPAFGSSQDGLVEAPTIDAAPAAELFATPQDLDEQDWLDWFASLTTHERRDHRDDIIVSGMHAGLTLQALGDLYHVTRERIRQIANAKGVDTRELRKLQKEQQERRARRLARRIYGTSLTYPELDVQEIAEWWDTDDATVRAALEHRLAVHEVRPYEGGGRTSDEDLLAALVEWGHQTSRPIGDDFTDWATERGLPGKQTIQIRFGSWNTGLALAGLSHLLKDRGGLRPQVSEETMGASLLEFFRDDLPSYSAQAYDDYARDKDLPSLAALRIRLGTWNEMKLRSRKLLRYAAASDGSWEWADQVLAISPQQEPRNVVTQEECLIALVRVAVMSRGPLTVTSYEAARETDEPGAHLIQSRCGSWIKALHLAGLDHRMSGKALGRVARGEVSFD